MKYEVTAFSINEWKREHYAFANSKEEADAKAKEAFKAGKLFPIVKEAADETAS